MKNSAFSVWTILNYTTDLLLFLLKDKGLQKKIEYKSDFVTRFCTLL